jgi:hypothetical protein
MRLSTSERSFLEAVERIFAAPEVLVVVRYTYGGGSRNFLILKDISELNGLINGLRRRDSVVVMKSFQKIKEGKVDQAFIEAAAAAYPKGSRIRIATGSPFGDRLGPWRRVALNRM